MAINGAIDSIRSRDSQKRTQFCRRPEGSSEIANRFVKHDFRAENPGDLRTSQKISVRKCDADVGAVVPVFGGSSPFSKAATSSVSSIANLPCS